MFTTRAIVVNYTNYRDYDRMVTLVSPDKGVINAVARGCRRAKSPLMNATERFVSGEFVIYEAKERMTIEQCSILESFYQLRVDYDRLVSGAYCLHALSQFAVPLSPCRDIFEITMKALAFLCYSKLPAPLVILAFELHVMNALGMTPLVDRCVICSKPFTDQSGRFDARLGGAVCLTCPCMGRPLSHGARRILLKTPKAPFESVELLNGHQSWPEAARHSREFFEYRLDQPPKVWPSVD